MSDEMITPQQLAEKLQCSISTVQNNVRSKKWPHVRLGPRMIRFTPEQVQGIIDGSMVAAETPRRRSPQSESIQDLMRRLDEQEQAGREQDNGPHH